MNALTTPSALTVITLMPSTSLTSHRSGQDLSNKPERRCRLKRLLAHTSSGFVLLTAALTCPQTHAMETSAAAASALKVLSMPLTETRGDVASAAAVTGLKNTAEPSSSGMSITVQKGESIDAVIRRGLPRLPLKDDFLRQALAKANPKIFPRGQTYPVKPGTVLLLPSLDELRQMITVQYPEMVMLMQKSSAESISVEAPKGPDKRHWVRFP